MRYHLITLITLCLLLAACGKDAQYSTWAINGEGFSTNQTEVMEAYRQGISGLAGGELENRFRLTFHWGELPTTYRYIMHHSSTNSIDEVIVVFYYHSKFYKLSKAEHKYIEASSANDKASYYMPPTWFVNYDDVNDSVLIEGTFKEA